MEQLIPE